MVRWSKVLLVLGNNLILRPFFLTLYEYISGCFFVDTAVPFSFLI